MQELQSYIILKLLFHIYFLFAFGKRKSSPYTGLRKEGFVKLINVLTA